MIVELLWGGVGSFLITSLVGMILIPLLRKKKAGQSIKEDGPVWHMTKQGTPTMGGIMFIAGIAVAVIAGYFHLLADNYAFKGALELMQLFGGMGFEKTACQHPEFRCDCSRERLELMSDRESRYQSAVVAPIISAGDAIGSVIICSNRDELSEAERKIAQTASAVLGKQMED